MQNPTTLRNSNPWENNARFKPLEFSVLMQNAEWEDRQEKWERLARNDKWDEVTKEFRKLVQPVLNEIRLRKPVSDLRSLNRDPLPKSAGPTSETINWVDLVLSGTGLVGGCLVYVLSLSPGIAMPSDTTSPSSRHPAHQQGRDAWAVVPTADDKIQHPNTIDSLRLILTRMHYSQVEAFWAMLTWAMSLRWRMQVSGSGMGTATGVSIMS